MTPVQHQKEREDRHTEDRAAQHGQLAAQLHFPSTDSWTEHCLHREEVDGGSWKRPPEAAGSQVVLSALSAAGEGRGRAHVPSTFALAGRPPWGRVSLRRHSPAAQKRPPNWIWSSARALGRGSAAGGGDTAANPTACHRRPDQVPRNSLSTRASVSSSPRRCGFHGSAAGGAELGPSNRGGKNQVGKSPAPQLGARTAVSATVGQPLPPRSEPLPAVTAASAEARLASLLGAETHGSRRRCLRTRVHLQASPAPAAPSSPLQDPRCAGRAQGCAAMAL